MLGIEPRALTLQANTCLWTTPQPHILPCSTSLLIVWLSPNTAPLTLKLPSSLCCWCSWVHTYDALSLSSVYTATQGLSYLILLKLFYYRWPMPAYHIPQSLLILFPFFLYHLGLLPWSCNSATTWSFELLDSLLLCCLEDFCDFLSRGHLSLFILFVYLI